MSIACLWLTPCTRNETHLASDDVGASWHWLAAHVGFRDR